MHVLIVVGDAAARAGIAACCAKFGATTEGVADIDAASATLARRDFDLAIVDLHPLDGDGVVLLRRVRALGSVMPVAICARLDAALLRGVMLDDGADVVTEPVLTVGDLLSRVRARARGHGNRTAHEARHSDSRVCASLSLAAG